MTLEDVKHKKLEKPETEEALLDETLLVDTFNTYYHKVFYYFLCHIHHQEQAQDLTGEVFCKVAAAWPSYDPSKGTLSTWIFTIARNQLSDHWRKKRPIQVELHDIPDGTDLAEHTAKEESKKMLYEALATLPEREREILSLKYSAGLKNTEIAALTNLTSVNVGVILFRSIKKLRKKLSNLL